MKYIIAGGRDFNDYNRLARECAKIIFFNKLRPSVVSGCCPNGADSLGIRWANKESLEIERFPAEWDKHGKAAGAIRNMEMAQNADALIAFWDGKSPGTKNMIENAHKARLETHVFYY